MSIKKYLPTLLLILGVYIAYFFFHLPTQQTSVHVLGANTNIVLYEEPDSGRQPVLDAINTSQKEVLAEVYLLSDKQIISALANAKSRGVAVKVILEEHPFGGGSLNQKTKQQLDADGVATQWSNPSFTLTHEKAMVIDGSEALILSQNLTASAFSKNREYDVVDGNPADVIEVRNIFIADWERKSITPPTNTNLIDSPDTSRSGLTTIITDAHKSLDLETEDINDAQIIALLSQKAKTMPVRILVPTLSQVNSNQQALAQLSQAGVQVKTISSPYMHAKMILADNAKAYIGSINFSRQSIDENRELGIILTQSDALQTIATTFEQDWDKGDSLTLN